MDGDSLAHTSLPQSNTHFHYHCPLCQAPDNFEQARFGLLRCGECGLVMSPDIWSPELEEHSAGWFGEDWDPAASAWVRRFESIGNAHTSKRLRHVRVSGSLLEIGFGSGSFLAEMQRRGWMVHGCDVSLSACQRATQRWNVPTHCGGVDSLPKDRRFDLVVMNHVLEHVQNPLDLLRAVRERMSPGGYLHVAVPNIACWEAHLPGWIGYQPYHFTYFARPTLSEALVRTGFHIESSFTHEQFASWFQSVVRTLVPNICRSANGNAAKDRTARSNASRLMHAYRATTVVFGALSWPVRRIQGKLGRGDEVIVVARNLF